jgi:hypothetical protein
MFDLKIVVWARDTEEPHGEDSILSGTVAPTLHDE